VRNVFTGFTTGAGGRLSEKHNELSGSIKGQEFTDDLGKHLFLKNDTVP
jgi:hypothetical protein